MGELLIRVLSLLIILTLQVWWIGLAILAVSIPLFRVSLKAGKENYEAYRNAEKKKREAEYLHKVLTERESAEERTLFGYSCLLYTSRISDDRNKNKRITADHTQGDIITAVKIGKRARHADRSRYGIL